MPNSLRLLAYPLASACLLLGLGILVQLLRWRKFGLGLMIVGLSWLYIWSTPVFSDWIRGSLESRYPMLTVEEMPMADAIVVLGGAFAHSEAWPYPNASASVDRYWHGARLYHAGRAPIIILSGGRTPGRGPGLTEARAGAQFLVDLGVPPTAIWLEEQALTTRANAVEVAELLAEHEIEEILLVTSALHMRRSMASFQAAGLNPIPAATDFEVRPSPSKGHRRWLPNAHALSASTRAFHEIMGYWTYSYRNWV
ncbi:MAG: YdcF family protein [Wenzhouxiangella sp.]|nr:MAG: YdcF family protein [Wenzhouxiangella sp.]